jgi:DNA (cytosine-5)-methyltransferase 1
MRHLDLFSGIGGFALAARWSGFETVAFCEIDQYCQKVLAKHWPQVPIYSDIKKLTRQGLESDGISQPDIITGGFPCQPFSVAGKQRGQDDNRHLWPEMLRIISELHPAWVVGENVSGFVRLALDDCISDLEGQGYAVQSFIIPACAVNASHRRDRVWIMAN